MKTVATGEGTERNILSGRAVIFISILDKADYHTLNLHCNVKCKSVYEINKCTLIIRR